MMRFVGNTFAKSFRRGMQDRGFSSGPVVTTTGKNIVECCFLGAFGCAGYVFAGLTLTPEPPEVQLSEEQIIRDNKLLDDAGF